jgi:hypothetical protein
MEAEIGSNTLVYEPQRPGLRASLAPSWTQIPVRLRSTAVILPTHSWPWCQRTSIWGWRHGAGRYAASQPGRPRQWHRYQHGGHDDDARGSNSGDMPPVTPPDALNQLWRRLFAGD